jgi:hypothetical protein
LLDYALPDSNGDEVSATMKRIKPDVRILMFSGMPHIPENARLHVDAFFAKRPVAYGGFGQDSRVAQLIRQSRLTG